jgi:malonyl CoA-acyl carrier protein transacylase
MMEPALEPLKKFLRTITLATAAAALDLQCDRHLDHAGAGDESRLLGVACAARPCASPMESANSSEAGHRVLLEVGPGQTLAGLARQHRRRGRCGDDLAHARTADGANPKPPLIVARCCKRSVNCGLRGWM